jgi:hypothetical protein
VVRAQLFLSINIASVSTAFTLYQDNAGLCICLLTDYGDEDRLSSIKIHFIPCLTIALTIPSFPTFWAPYIAEEIFYLRRMESASYPRLAIESPFLT